MTSPNVRTGARMIVDALRQHGVDTVFQVPGESFLAVLDSLLDARNDVKVVTCRHESGATNMADAYGKLTGRPGIAFVTRGPGACHGSVGVHVAKQDSTPMILFVGQVETTALGREAFQEVDVAQMFGWTAKWAANIPHVDLIPEYISRAFHTALNGRMGPVVLGLPEDIQTATSAATDAGAHVIAPLSPAATDLAAAARLLSEAERPIVIMGGTGWTQESCDQLRQFAERHNLPVTVTFRRQDRFDNRHPNYVGDLAFSPDPALVRAMADCDLILAINTRLGERTTQGYVSPAPPRPRQRLIHIFPDAAELGRVYRADIAIAAAPVPTAAALAALAPAANRRWDGWTRALRENYEKTWQPVPCPGNVDMNAVMAVVRERLPEDAIIASDAGNFAQWVQRFYPFRRLGTMLAPAAGAMGYGVPAAVGAKVIAPQRRVVGFIGDGGFLMTGNELATAIQYGLDPVIIVVNNGMYGTIRGHQENHFPGRVSSTDLTNPDFAAFARAFGAHGETVTRTVDFAPAFDRALAARKAAVIDVHLDREVVSTRSTLTSLRQAAEKKRRS
ncbi:MAG: thiamine pyrophosphate-binding protein [Alphaproteobacteria bacterium]|nr:thiamine pyrophosphate-binding protein [Alphaproteobacteria bacterium]